MGRVTDGWFGGINGRILK